MAAQSSAESKPYVVVVGVDFSPASELAVEKALELAAAQPHAEVHLINVVQTYGPQVAYEMPGDSAALTVLTTAEAGARFKEYADKQLARFSSANPGKSFGRAFTHLRYDSISDEIAQLAADLEADLVVVGTHGRRGVSRLLLGSTAEATVRLAPCPVLVMRPKALQEAPPRIEPPCPRCLETRRATAGNELWCEQHRERHGQRHTYHQGDRAGSDREMPLALRQ
jgi:nucleotide-binding universal stress UspA family protein